MGSRLRLVLLSSPLQKVTPTLSRTLSSLPKPLCAPEKDATPSLFPLPNTQRERSSLSACLGALFVVSFFPFITHVLNAYYVPATGESKQIKQTRAVSSVSEEKEQGAQFGGGAGE